MTHSAMLDLETIETEPPSMPVRTLENDPKDPTVIQDDE